MEVQNVQTCLHKLIVHGAEKEQINMCFFQLWDQTRIQEQGSHENHCSPPPAWFGLDGLQRCPFMWNQITHATLCATAWWDWCENACVKRQFALSPKRNIVCNDQKSKPTSMRACVSRCVHTYTKHPTKNLVDKRSFKSTFLKTRKHLSRRWGMTKPSLLCKKQAPNRNNAYTARAITLWVNTSKNNLKPRKFTNVITRIKSKATVENTSA